MSGFAVRRIEELEAIHGGAVRLAAAELGIRSFGMQVLEFPAGFPDYPEHDHAEDGQEEVYFVLRGAADFEVGGESVRLEEGAMLYVEPGVSRRLVPGPEGVQFLAIGCVTEGSYERPDDFQLAGRR
jgi:mannose-6-phosphate isomerase-like protein (cupin superfamily)